MENTTPAPGLVEALVETQARVEQQEKQRQDVEQASNYNSKEGIGEMLTAKVGNRAIEVIVYTATRSVHLEETCWRQNVSRGVRHTKGDKMLQMIQLENPLYPFLSEHVQTFIKWSAHKNYQSKTVVQFYESVTYKHQNERVDCCEIVQELQVQDSQVRGEAEGSIEGAEKIQIPDRE